jgi:hypothetical protein
MVSAKQVDSLLAESARLKKSSKDLTALDFAQQGERRTP